MEPVNIYGYSKPLISHISCSQKKVEDFPGCDVMPASPDVNWIESCEGDPGSRGVAKNEQNNPELTI